MGDWGFEIAFEATVDLLNQETQTSLGKFGASSLNVLPIPKLQVALGLPAGFEVGMGFLGGIQDLTLLSFGLVKTWLDLEFMAVDTRASFGTNKLSNFSATNWSFEAISSFPLGITEPYVYLGLAGASISLNDLNAQQLGQLAGLESSRSFTSAYFGFGLPLKLGFFHLRPEAQFFTIGEFSVGTRLAFVL